MVLADTKSAVAEAFRTVRTNLQFANLDETRRTMLVTSAGPGEGKSTVAANLAVTMAFSGTRTLLVDTDLRRPVLHKLFGIPNTAGLTSLLTDGAVIGQRAQATRLPNLFVLTSGPIPPNPAEVLLSKAMTKFVESARGDYDCVVFDSPPIVSVADPLILAGLVEGVILVVKSGTYAHELIQRAKSQLEGVKASILGILLNSVDLRRERHYYLYYYYYYHGYGYGYGEGRK
jgi:capsular exopolysaccharide synthesis family protein